MWTSDITYLPMAHGFLYLAAILDVASRKVLAFRLSNTLTADFCVEALEQALAKFGAPEIFNTDQVELRPNLLSSNAFRRLFLPSCTIADVVRQA